MTTPLAHYLRVHLAGSAGGIRLFHRAGGSLLDEQAARVVRDIARELGPERAFLLALAERHGSGRSPVLETGVAVGERLGRLVPHDSLWHRTPTTDLVEIEAMRDAVLGKLAGWEALIAVADDHDLPLDELERLATQARDQAARLVEVHALAARRALGR